MTTTPRSPYDYACCDHCPLTLHGHATPNWCSCRTDVRPVSTTFPALPVVVPVRPLWDEYFLDIAKAVAKRADCTRRHAGAVIVGADRRIVSTGYNGAPSGELGCLTAGACPRGRQNTAAVAPGSSYDTGAGSCTAVHAEANAIIYGEYTRFKGATIYVVSLNPDGSLHEQQSPCGGCERLIKGAGIARVVTP